MDPSSFSGATAIVTGASRGIGRLLAVALAERGVDLALAARTQSGLEETVAEARRFGVRAIPIPCDVTKREDLVRLVDTTVSELGPPDILINNAGVESVVDYRDVSLEEIETVMVTNAVSPMLLTRLVIPHMVKRKSGHIVNMSSVAGKSAAPFFSIYNASKHALVGFSWALRQEMEPHGIGVSVICPAFVADTGMADEWVKKDRPRMAATIAPEKVVRGTIRAIEKNKAEVVVSSGLSRISDVSFAVSPDVTAAIMRATGVHEFFAEEAKARPNN